MYEGYTLDFVSPWLYGIAKKMISKGLRAMINPSTGNLVINAAWRVDNSTQRPERFYHRKIFELKAIAGAFLGEDLVFLIVSQTEYAVWKIKDEGATLIPTGFNIGQRTNRVDVDSAVNEGTLNSVVKPDKNYSEHYFSVQDNDDPVYNHNYYTYGLYRDRDANGLKELMGLRDGYQPPDWDINIGWTVSNIFGYLYYSQSPDAYPWYLCSSRHPFIIYNGKVIKNLEIWQIDATTLEIHYDSIDGEGLIGETVPNSKKFAALTPDLYVGHGEVYVPELTSTYTYGQHFDCGCCVPFNNCVVGCPDGVDLLTSSYEIYIGDKYPYNFGNVSLGDYGLGGYKTTERAYTSFFADCVTGLSGCNLFSPTWLFTWHQSGGACTGGTMEGTVYRLSYELVFEIRDNSSLYIMDYDNLIPNVTADKSVNIDDTFIMICYEGGNTLSNPGRRDEYDASPVWVKTWLSPLSGCSKYQYGNWQDWYTTTRESFWESKHYRLKYRLKGGSVITVDICDYSTIYNKKVDTVTGYTLVSPGSCAAYWDKSVSSTNTGLISGGTKLMYPTCIATEKYLFYSYITKTGWGPYPGSPSSLDFDKRILGIIDIESGKRTEHTVNDALLGDLYKDTFDEEKASAVGLHRR